MKQVKSRRRTARELTSAELEECRRRVDELCYQSFCSANVDLTSSLASAYEARRVAVSYGDRYSIIQSLNSIANAYLNIGEVRKAMRYYRGAEAKVTGDTDEDLGMLSGLRRNIGICEARRGRYSRSVALLAEALELSERVGYRERAATIMGEMGTALRHLGQYAKALDLVIRSKEILDELGTPERRWTARIKLGGIYIALDQYEKAIETYSEALTLIRANGARAVEGSVLGSMAGIYRLMKEHDAALRIFPEAVSLLHESGRRNDEANTLRNFALVHKELGAYEQARQLLEQAREIFYAIQNDLFCTIVELDLADVNIQLGNDAVALAIIESTFQRPDTFEDQILKAQALELRARIHERRGEFAEALELYRSSEQLQKSILDKKRSRETVMLELRHEMARIERERDEFRRRVEALEQSIEHRRMEIAAGMLQYERRGGVASSIKQELSAPHHQPHELVQQALEGALMQGDDGAWQGFQRKFDQVFPEFVRAIVQRRADLTPTEIRVCCLLRLGLSSKEIADVLCVSMRTVDNHRHHIRGKLSLAGTVSLISYFASF